MVVLFHATGMVQTLPDVFRYMFAWGYCGVDFFFVLSGFILLYVHYSQIGHAHKVRDYLVKRFARIFPAYWAVLALVVPLCLIVPGMVSPGKKHLAYITASLFLLPQWDPFLGVAWSLSCEIFFYLIFALLLVNPKSFAAATALWIVLIAANLLHPLYPPLDFLCQPRTTEFLAGMYVAWIIRKGFRFSMRQSFGLIAVGVALCFLAGYIQIARGLGGIAYPLWFGLAAVLILSSLVSLELCGVAFAGGLWLLLGDASYSIYLVHYPVLLLAVRLLPGHSALLGNWFLAITAAVVAGIVFHLLIEKHVCALCRTLIEGRSGSNKYCRPSMRHLHNAARPSIEDSCRTIS